MEIKKLSLFSLKLSISFFLFIFLLLWWAIDNDINVHMTTQHLHPGLHHVQRRVAKDAGGSGRGSEHGCDDRVHFFPGVVTLAAGAVRFEETESERVGRNEKHSSWTRAGLTFVPVAQ